MKNKLILITVVHKILDTFDMRDYLHTFIATKWSMRNKLLEVERGTCPIAGDTSMVPTDSWGVNCPSVILWVSVHSWELNSWWHGVQRINEVGPSCRGDHLWADTPSRYVTSQLVQLSLASLQWRLNWVPAFLGLRRDCHLCRVAGNIVIPYGVSVCELP